MKDIWKAILRFILGETNLDEKISEKANTIHDKIQSINDIDAKSTKKGGKIK